MGDYSGAKECLEKALELTPDYPEAQEALADVDACLEVIKELESFAKARDEEGSR